jgi:hypothetical protein
LRIAIRKEEKPYAQSFENKPEHRAMHCRKGKSKMCREVVNDAQDTSIEVGRTS